MPPDSVTRTSIRRTSEGARSYDHGRVAEPAPPRVRLSLQLRIGVLLVALVAVLGAPSPAVAKGGAGGGGSGATTPGCAVIQSWTKTLTTSATGQPFVTMTFGVNNQCGDEFGASRAMVELDPPADAAPAQTTTFSAFRINGQVQDSRTVTYAQLMQMVQPAA